MATLEVCVFESFVIIFFIFFCGIHYSTKNIICPFSKDFGVGGTLLTDIVYHVSR